MVEISDKSLISRHEGIVYNKLDDELVMMSIANGEYYGLDSVGARIWDAIVTPKSFKELVDVLKEEYEVSEEQCKADTLEFLEAMEEKKLIIISE